MNCNKSNNIKIIKHVHFWDRHWETQRLFSFKNNIKVFVSLFVNKDPHTDDVQHGQHTFVPSTSLPLLTITINSCVPLVSPSEIVYKCNIVKVIWNDICKVHSSVLHRQLDYFIFARCFICNILTYSYIHV